MSQCRGRHPLEQAEAGIFTVLGLEFRPNGLSFWEMFGLKGCVMTTRPLKRIDAFRAMIQKYLGTREYQGASHNTSIEARLYALCGALIVLDVLYGAHRTRSTRNGRSLAKSSTRPTVGGNAPSVTASESKSGIPKPLLPKL